MRHFAQYNAVTRIVFNILHADLPESQVLSENMVEIGAGDNRLGQRYDPITHAFASVTPPAYTVQFTDPFGVVRTLASDDPITEQQVFNALYPNITRLQFRRLFTLNERIALDGIEASAAPDLTKATVRTLKEDFASAQFISLEDPLTVQAINAFAQMGLINSGRVAQILAGQIPA